MVIFQVSIEDIKKVYSLFVDEKRSMQYLRELQDEYMFHEEDLETSGKYFYIRRVKFRNDFNSFLNVGIESMVVE